VARTTLGGLVACCFLAACAVMVWGPLSSGAATSGVTGAPPGGRASAPDPVGAAQAVPEGERLYVQHCASCHGPTGAGTPYGPGLGAAGTAALDFYMRTGRMPLSAPGEPQYRQEPVLTPDQVAAITAYAADLGTGPDIPQVATGGADLHRGWEIYINDCAACHSTSGAGGSVGGGQFAPSLQDADALTVAEAVIIGPGVMPAFPIRGQDLDALAAYVGFLGDAPAPGGLPLAGVGPVPEGFVAIFVGLSLLVVVTRWVARRTES
jgi:ubiquinol-cytochrome c reductase cytochrome c subunit